MTDPLSIAARIVERAKHTGPRPPIDAQELEDMLTAVDALRHLYAITNALEQFEPHGITLIPG